MACWMGGGFALAFILGFPLISNSQTDSELSPAEAPEVSTIVPLDSAGPNAFDDEFGGDRQPGLSIPTDYPVGDNREIYEEIATEADDYNASYNPRNGD